MRIIRGTRDAKGNVFQKQPAGGTGRIRCMKCQNLCTRQRMPDGREVMKCGGCGAAYAITQMSGPRALRPGEVPKRAHR
jgi:hypothetical protein